MRLLDRTNVQTIAFCCENPAFSTVRETPTFTAGLLSTLLNGRARSPAIPDAIGPPRYLTVHGSLRVASAESGWQLGRRRALRAVSRPSFPMADGSSRWAVVRVN
jgi:hypothetical protein